VGYRGSNNSMLIQSGADYSTFTTSLGGLAGADGNSLTVTGAGSTFTGVNINADLSSFNVGGAGDNNSLMVSDGAVFTIGDRLAIGQTNTSGRHCHRHGAGSGLLPAIPALAPIGGRRQQPRRVGWRLCVDRRYPGKVRQFDLTWRAVPLSMPTFSPSMPVRPWWSMSMPATPVDVDVIGTATLSGNLDVNWSGGAIANRYNLLTAGAQAAAFATVDTAGFAPASPCRSTIATGADLVLVASLGGHHGPCRQSAHYRRYCVGGVQRWW